jgi:hypothetical protein
MTQYGHSRCLGIAALLCLVAACSPKEPEAPAGTLPDRNIATGGDLVITVNMDTGLENSISIGSATGARPGEKNPVETSITIHSESAQGETLQLRGEWYDASGNSYGGSTSTLEIGPGQSREHRDATRSTRASGYRLSLTRNVQSADERYAAALSDPANRVAEGYGMTWSETAADEVIPALPIRGFANGEAFTAKTIAFYQGQQDKWRLEISDHGYDVLKGVAAGRLERRDMQTIYLNFDAEPVAGQVLGREMAYGGGIFQIRTTDGSGETTSWNTSIAYAIHVDSWEKGAHREQPCGWPTLGAASGKLFIAFKGSELSFENSWVSGEFKDIPVVYCGG